MDEVASPCPTCGAAAELVDGRAVYPHRPDLASKRFWRCPAGHAHVGCHPGTTRPLGAPATEATRRARMRAHAAFDPLWRRKMARDGCSRGEARTAAYRWLAEQLGIPAHRCHIGSFDEAQCARVVVVCNPKEA